MGFVSYASLVSKEQLDETIKEIRENSLAQTDFEKRQEEVGAMSTDKGFEPSNSLSGHC